MSVTQAHEKQTKDEQNTLQSSWRAVGVPRHPIASTCEIIPKAIKKFLTNVKARGEASRHAIARLRAFMARGEASRHAIARLRACT